MPDKSDLYKLLIIKTFLAL